MSQGTPAVQHSAETLAEKGISFYDLPIDFVRIQWTDLSNHTCCRVVPRSQFIRLLAKSRPGICLPNVALGLVNVTAAPGFSASGEYLYVFDMSTLRICPQLHRTAAVMGWFQHKTVLPSPGGELKLAVPICPRTTLKSVVDEAKSALGVSFLVGFETEFILLKSTRPIVSLDSTGYSHTSALRSGAKETEALEEMARALQAASIELLMYHPEAAPGQYEIVTGPLPPLEAADALVHTREIIYNIAQKHGFKATLAPRVFKNSCGTAMHAHVSVHSSQPKEDRLWSTYEATFLAGVLEHLPALAAFTLPLNASYDRVVDGVWSGGTYVCWGTENRETPVRLCHAASAEMRNFELKCVDGTANPYVALVGVLGAGVAGIRLGTFSTINDCADKSPAEIGEPERIALGIVDRLPLTLTQAWENLRADHILRDILGMQFVDAYLSVNQVLASSMAPERFTLEDLVEKY